ncbi:unnamed protein product [Linum trigynum]|uniref:Uncharacterized protein n=1 Tax=Linum trigynum TaxID=586398 RepID=A0AAV2D923_9ROSI
MSPTNSNPINLTALAAAATFLTALLLVPTEASVRTTVIIDHGAAGNWWGVLGDCQQYVVNEAVRDGGGSNGNLPSGGRPREMYLEMCCRQLKEMSTAADDAYCVGIEKSMRELMEQPRTQVIMREEDVESAWEIAGELPGKCGASVSRCHFNRPTWF